MTSTPTITAENIAQLKRAVDRLHAGIEQKDRLFGPDGLKDPDDALIDKINDSMRDYLIDAAEACFPGTQPLEREPVTRERIAELWPAHVDELARVVNVAAQAGEIVSEWDISIELGDPCIDETPLDEWMRTHEL